MNDGFSMGWLLPAWIIGAPLVLALFDWMRTPSARHESRDHRASTAPMRSGVDDRGDLAAARR